ncbi:MAG: LuxR family transcriptional regulator [Gemmatimonadales bacterium]|nr:MAG: LuxR family transcriptional regulator [Gemmatimonadales bacterium]
MSHRKNEITRREREVLRLAASGLTDKGISGKLGISTSTVSSHMRSILLRTGSVSRTQAAVRVFSR